MNIGIPAERRPFEYRVGMSPAGVELLTQSNHTVYVEHDAGKAAGFSDIQYEHSGAKIVYSAREVFGRSELILKLARPLIDEITWMNPGTILMGFLQLASAREDRIQGLLQNEITSIAYEQIMLPDGSFPVLKPLSQIGGLLSSQIAAKFIQTNLGGKGILLGGIVGVPPAEVVIIGAGNAGTNAAKSFLGLGAHVTVLDRSMKALEIISDKFPAVTTIPATSRNLQKSCSYADVVVGAVMWPGTRAPIVITREMVKKMKPRSLIIDLSIDLGGCCETSRPTTHDQPTYVEEGVIHYCVPNIPALVARTATHAFVNASVPYIQDVISNNVESLISDFPSIEVAINTHKGILRNVHQWHSDSGDIL